MAYIQGKSRSQTSLFLLSLEELISEDHLVQRPRREPYGGHFTPSPPFHFCRYATLPVPDEQA